MKTSHFTADMPYHGIQNKGFKDHIMKEKEYIEKQESIQELREAIFDGFESGIAEDFEPKSHLEYLRREYRNV